MLFRIFTTIALLFSVIFAPFWLSVLIALGAMIYFNFFLEAILIFLLTDLLYGTQGAKHFNVVFFYFILSGLLFLVIELIKSKIRTRNDY